MKLCTASVVDGFDGLVLCAFQTDNFSPRPEQCDVVPMVCVVHWCNALCAWMLHSLIVGWCLPDGWRVLGPGYCCFLRCCYSLCLSRWRTGEYCLRYVAAGGIRAAVTALHFFFLSSVVISLSLAFRFSSSWENSHGRQACLYKWAYYRCLFLTALYVRFFFLLALFLVS